MKYPIVFLALAAACSAYAQAGHDAERRMAFQPIAGSAYGRESDADIHTLPFLIPVGYQQRVVSSERDLNLYVGSDMLDMNTVNETGRQAGRYLYRTHEVRPGAVGNDGNSRRRDGGSGGAVSVVDLQTGVARELVGRPDWEALDGIVWTPWRTLLVAEEAHTTTLNMKNGSLSSRYFSAIVTVPQTVALVLRRITAPTSPNPASIMA